MRDFPPTNERRSQGLLTHLRTVTTRALGGSTAKKYAPHTPPETHPVQNSPRAAGPGAHPVQNSPRTPTPAAQPVQNSPNTPKIAHFSPFCPSRENFVPHQQPNRYKTLPAQPVQALTRYKTLPTRPRQQPNRYKTLPTRPKRPISASFARAGRTLYRFHHHDPQQGELCTALTITMPSRENFVPRPAPNPVQNSPCSAGPSAQPVQNSPNTPKKAYFSPFYPSRENFVPLSPPCPPAGRTLYRSHHHDAQQGELCTAPSAKPGTKLSQHAHTSSPTGTKLSQHAQNCRFQPVLPEQGELCTALTTTTPAGRTFYRTQRQTRYKTLPTRPRQQPTRYKTLPTRPKRPISASFARAGRTLYRIHHHDPSRENFVPHQQPNRYKTLPVQPIHRPNRYKTLPTHPASSPTGTKLSPHTQKGPFQPVLPEQGELCTALTITMPSRENFVPRPAPNPVQNSPCSAGPSAQPVQNSPNTPTPAAQPVQNSPSTPRQQPNRYKTPPTRTVPHPCRE